VDGNYFHTLTTLDEKASTGGAVTTSIYTDLLCGYVIKITRKVS